MTYRDTLTAHADEVAGKVLRALERLEAGEITVEAFKAIVVALIRSGNLTAAMLADLALAAELTAATGAAVAPLGIPAAPHFLDSQRLTTAATTLLTAAAGPERWQRLALGEVKEAAATAYGDGIKKSRRVKGWTRRLSGDACQLCRWWWRDGRVWDKSTPFQHHKGCTCSPVPVVVSSDHKNLQNTAQAARSTQTRTHRERTLA